jgi:hypothetical protein
MTLSNFRVVLAAAGDVQRRDLQGTPLLHMSHSLQPLHRAGDCVGGCGARFATVASMRVIHNKCCQ